ncbi:MAG: TetR/AcrR family transcriptional regulator C-terminal domain-containing protein [Erysipelotrichaceae bacterium]|nr:TetR/AcrR family transcriptional regulator C-terminal domain-containing protein [Erysipelotrichaceae bacterium]
MADSSITKRALASSLKKLMEDSPFEKIQIGQICERCEMHRKSFYYHFMDKYDLLNWIFDSEIASYVNLHADQLDANQRVERLRQAYHYLYENRDFYRKALKIEGQNSFKSHFRDFIQDHIKTQTAYFLHEEIDDFELNVLSDVALSLIENWLMNPNCMPPDEMTERTLHLLNKKYNFIV